MGFNPGYEIVHMVRQRVRCGVKIKTRCGVEAKRSSRDNPSLFVTESGTRLKCVYPTSAKKPTCGVCCRWLGIKDGKGMMHKRGLSRNRKGMSDARSAGTAEDDLGELGLGE